MKAFKLIAVSQINYERLKDFGRAGDSFNDVLTDLINRVKDEADQIDESN